MEEDASDFWDSGEALERYVGRWSRLVAGAFLTWLAVPLRARWLDVGCGPGALTEAILRLASPAAVTGVDPSENYVAFARARIEDPGATFEVGNAMALAAQTATYDAVVAGLVLNFVPEAETAGDAARWHRGRICMGLRRRHVPYAEVLGCSCRARRVGDRDG
jgi:2-polyprenyl-3-methyl-5-hydroxy-6-metoxy-1,4-benzoquinol methylase